MESNIKGLVTAGHEMASELKAECGAVDMRSVAKLISYLATQLEVQLVRANALAAENATLNDKMNRLLVWPGIEFYSSAWEFCNLDGNDALEFMCDNKTTATDAFWLKYVRRHATRGLTTPQAVLLLRSITDLSISLCVKFSTLHA